MWIAARSKTITRYVVLPCAKKNRREIRMFSNRKTLIALMFSLLWGFWAASVTQAVGPGWNRQEAEAKLGIRVQCASNPNQRLLQWGPNFPGWDRSSQPKAIGRSVIVSSTGTIKEIMKVSEGQYQVVVHWDRANPKDPYWSTAIGPAEYGVTVLSVVQLELVGNWSEIGRKATIEFLKDGGFEAVDNEGLAVAGRYYLINDTSLKFEIHQKETPAEIVTLDFSLLGDNLTLTSAEGRGGVERYRKEK